MAELNLMPDRVLVALSGGVDSSVCVRVLQDQGFAVEAMVISFSPAHAGAVEAARRAAEELAVPLAVHHCEDLFEAEVVAPFCEAYAKGTTPNPCVLCNPAVKFRLLAEEADRRGIRFIASGHYARVVEQDGIWYPARAMSAARDQSYMLYRLPQAILARLCLPLGEFEKQDIRDMARALGLSSADAPDSQEICFIPGGNYPAFLHSRGVHGLAGRFIGPDGEDLGPHKGAEHYTVGQRRGIGLALGTPVFVKAILPNGDVQLARAGEEYSSAVTLRDVVTQNGRPLADGDEYDVKIRSVAKPTPCVVHHVGGAPALVFAAPLRAPAPGQHAVLYKNGLVMGGGVIHNALAALPLKL